MVCGAFLGVVPLAVASDVSPWFARTWLTEHGLPDNDVTGALQSADGYLWIGTHNGLARFDGVQFENISLPNVSGRPELLIRCLLMGDDDTLWLAAEAGIVMQLGRGVTNTFTTAAGLPTFRPMSMAQDRTGAVWIGYADGSVCQIVKGSVKRFFGLPGAGSCSIAADAEGQIWFAREGRVGLFRTNQFIGLLTFPEKTVRLQGASKGGVWIAAGLRLLKFKEGGQPVQVGEIAPERTGAEPSVLFEDKPGGLWIGTAGGGLFHFDGAHATHVDTSHSDILSIGEDREGSIWVGTAGGGLNRLRPRVLEMQGVESGLPGESIRSVGEDTAGVRWAVAQNGGLARSTDAGWKTLSDADGWPKVRATCVTSDGAGGVWIGTYHGGLAHWQNDQATLLRRKDGLASEITHALFLDRDRNLWVGWESTNCLQRWRDGKWTTLTQTPGSRTIRALAQDTVGQVWAGTSDGFLFRIQNDALVNETSRTVSPPIPIRCLYAPPSGGLWIGYAGGGLGRLHNGKFGRVWSQQGLHDDGICSIMPDGNGSLWIGSDHGIFQVNERELERVAAGEAETVRSIVYGRDEGLPNLAAAYGETPGALRSRDGLIWFCTRTGMAVIRPDRVRANRIPPLVHIERVRVDGRAQPLLAETSLRLPPRHHKVEFEIAALSFIAPENVRWKYRLDGVDNDWVEGGAQRVATYPQLAAGQYKFRVVACNSTGLWNDLGAQLAFIVDPFYWQTWWFRLAALAAFTCGIVAVVRYVSFRRLRNRLQLLEQETALQRERQRIARDIHDELGASLTQIGMLAGFGMDTLEDRPQTQQHLGTIATRARRAVTALDEIVWAVNPRNDSLPRLADYLCRIADDCCEASATVRCRKEVPTGLPPVPVRAEVRHNLALAVKEAINNALKHGRPETVWLRLNWNAPQLFAEVADDGVGFDPVLAQGQGNGLGNQSARLKDIEGTLAIESEPGRGTRVRFWVRIAG